MTTTPSPTGADDVTVERARKAATELGATYVGAKAAPAVWAACAAIRSLADRVEALTSTPIAALILQREELLSERAALAVSLEHAQAWAKQEAKSRDDAIASYRHLSFRVRDLEEDARELEAERDALRVKLAEAESAEAVAYESRNAAQERANTATRQLEQAEARAVALANALESVRILLVKAGDSVAPYDLINSLNTQTLQRELVDVKIEANNAKLLNHLATVVK